MELTEFENLRQSCNDSRKRTNASPTECNSYRVNALPVSKHSLISLISLGLTKSRAQRIAGRNHPTLSRAFDCEQHWISFCLVSDTELLLML